MDTSVHLPSRIPFHRHCLWTRRLPSPRALQVVPYIPEKFIISTASRVRGSNFLTSCNKCHCPIALDLAGSRGSFVLQNPYPCVPEWWPHSCTMHSPIPKVLTAKSLIKHKIHSPRGARGRSFNCASHRPPKVLLSQCHPIYGNTDGVFQSLPKEVGN